MRCVFNRFALYLMRFMAYLIFVNAVGMSHVFNHWVDSHWVAIGNLPYISSINNACLLFGADSCVLCFSDTCSFHF